MQKGVDYLKPDLIIFNIDNTVLNTRNLIKESLESIFNSLNLKYEDSLLNKIIDNPINETKQLVSNYYDETNYAETIFESYKIILKRTSCDKRIKIKEDAKELLNYLKEKQYNIVGITFNNKESVSSKLNENGLTSYFSSILAFNREDTYSTYTRKLSDVAKKFNVIPSKCMIFDDSRFGIKAAHDNDMLPMLVLNSNDPSEDALINSFKILKNLNSAKKIID